MTIGIPCGDLTLIPSARGVMTTCGPVSIGVSRWPTDPVGTATVAFLGVNTGSEIRVSLSDMAELAGVESCAANQVLTWGVYSSGSPNNTVRIVIVHPDYKIKEFTYLSQIGNQSIPVQQEPDKWYSNPA